MKLPPLYTYREPGASRAEPGRAFHGIPTGAYCVRCGKPLGPSPVWLEFDQRVAEYHDFGGVPENLSQGSFEFGPDCADALRKRARVALAALKSD